MNLDARAGSLRAEQLNSVIAFARDARANATSRIAVRYASGSSKARKVASEAAAVLAAQGVPRSSITTASYKGGGSTVTLSFHRKVAVSAECGDWSANLAGDQYNDPYPNFGCSMQQNIAAMVANPEDHENPRAMTPLLGGTRSATIKKYNSGQTVAAGINGSGSSSDSGSDTTAPTTP
jgi:pilus assembly protein CpaD